MDALLEPTKLSSLVRTWLDEDVPSVDYGGAVVGDVAGSATLLAKSPGILAGKPFVDAVFRELECKVEWADWIEDGVELMGPFPVKLALVSGPVRRVLLGERVALNTIARCSGVATKSAELVKIARDYNWGGRVAGTRKTTPGFRLVEKYGMLVGGADTHRMDLSSMVMLKDNHIHSRGNIREAVQHAKRLAGFSVKVEVECSSFEDAVEASEAGADVVMLDNFEPSSFCETAARVREANPHIIIEGSGGLNAATLSKYMCKDADVLSLSISQGAPIVDFSLKIAAAPGKALKQA
mmetsp:Transcript_5553/g.16561  ORF Transcript_5553/g.16561 Transcript_5553/m.16561 type:complete len:295 (+) Transcript_5553:178-1062(+)|eukprot:CAMPEP_0198729490 /NCGR_PEP_ID=MMETSP1475-20131203/18849_1 /TAXON_ID= ORGANISM="Unidentified sp., Strain CCMP1999" /NCGR_SAMPLE_ID=MMETSP1475 /ASSEMBLY_ACC=CAM_ASM_001111 /LENGTH=294 /DNA_ID=CAMNT_0044492157 /DNA_START=112 /DNA_END=996 /DNA_ORIENTATION=+